MNIRVNLASDVVLDFLVSKIEGYFVDTKEFTEVELFRAYRTQGKCNYTSNWQLCGEIIDKEEIELTIDTNHSKIDGQEHKAEIAYDCVAYGQNFRQAAMRCYIISKLGNEVEFPADEILTSY